MTHDLGNLTRTERFLTMLLATPLLSSQYTNLAAVFWCQCRSHFDLERIDSMGCKNEIQAMPKFCLLLNNIFEFPRPTVTVEDLVEELETIDQISVNPSFLIPRNHHELEPFGNFDLDTLPAQSLGTADFGVDP